MKDKDFLLIQGDMMSRLHLKAGPMRDLFALIYNISKDGIHTYRASREQIAEWLCCSERHVADIIKTLLDSGYINRVARSINGGHAVYEYTTNYEELLARAMDGEDIRPIPMKRRGPHDSVADKKGGESSPFLENEEKGGESDIKRVVKVPKKGGESSPTKGYNKDTESILSEPGALAREDEKREFLKIFFMRNSADPAEELRRFLGIYQSREWWSRDGKIHYDTFSKRCGLAYAWEFNKGTRLTKCDATDRFYEFLKGMYKAAVESGRVDIAGDIIDTKCFYTIDGKNLTLRLKHSVHEWMEGLGNAFIRTALNTHFGEGTNLFYWDHE